jgi:uncharacterized membrane protein
MQPITVLLRAGLCTLALLCSAAAIAAPPLFRVSVLPENLVMGPLSIAGLNNRGEVSGSCQAPEWRTIRICVWSEATGVRTFRDPQNPDTVLVATAANNNGSMVGMATVPPPFGGERPFAWDAVNGVRYLAPLGSRWVFNALNDANEAVGHQDVGIDSLPSAFRWSDAGGFVLLEPTAYSSQAKDINSSGVAVGVRLQDGDNNLSRYEALRWIDGMSQVLLPNAGGHSQASAVNDAGQIVGWYHPKLRGPKRAFLWSADQRRQNIDPRPLSVYQQSEATDVNNAGQVVGDWAFLRRPPEKKVEPFYWDAETGMVPLFSLLDPDYPNPPYITPNSVGAARINDAGQVLVRAFVSGLPRWLLLTPTR